MSTAQREANQLEALSPAKLNLFLHITGRRPDGYHNLQTLFQFIDLCDLLTFTLRNDGELQLDFPDTSLNSADNLVMRAAQALKRETGCTQGADIVVKKQIPMGGGLGGGSSNAATALVALNQLWHTELSTQRLADIGVTLGADVPIFIHGHAAIAEGVGDIFQDVTIEEPWYLLMIPPCHVPTARLFQEKQLTRDSCVITLCAFLNGDGHNDFEPVTRSLFPEVESAIQALNHVGNARMTGTGACIFAPYATRQLAEDAAGKLSDIVNTRNMQHFAWRVVRGVNKSPLYTGKLVRRI